MQAHFNGFKGINFQNIFITNELWLSIFSHPIWDHNSAPFDGRFCLKLCLFLITPPNTYYYMLCGWNNINHSMFECV